MARLLAVITLLTVASHLPLASAVSPVQKVIQLIDEMSAKVTRDQKDASAAYIENAKFCDEEVVKKGYAMKGAQSDIEALSATKEDETAKISEYTSKIDELGSSISSSQSELDEAVALRAKEHSDFVAVEKTMVTTVDELTRAHGTLKKSLGLMQFTPDARKALDSSMKALGELVEASFVTHAQRKKVQEYLQARANAEEGLTLASAVKGAGAGEAILETLQDMTDKAEGTLSDTRKTEMEAAHAHAMVKQGMESEVKSLTEELAESTHAKAVATEADAVATKDLAAAKKGLQSDEAYTRNLMHECMLKSQEWEVLHRDTVAELTALDKAKAILTKKFALVQASSTQRLKVRTAAQARVAGEDAKNRALRFVQQLGKRLHSTALVSLAYRAAADPFVKVRGMVEDMISKLMAEAAEAATKKAFCDEEQSKTDKSQADREGKIAKLDARIEKSEAAIAELTEGIATLSGEISELDTAVAEATQIRESEKAAFLVEEKDLSESEKACEAALEVLREYYEGALLVQLGTTRATTGAAAAGNDGSGIIGVLEVAESDFAQNLAEVKTAEITAADEYNKLMQDSKLTKATKEMELKGKESEIKSLKTSLSDSNEDRSGLSTELDALLAYKAELKPQCETKVPSYAERKAAREKEIEGLKEALSILAA